MRPKYSTIPGYLDGSSWSPSKRQAWAILRWTINSPLPPEPGYELAERPQNFHRTFVSDTPPPRRRPRQPPAYAGPVCAPRTRKRKAPPNLHEPDQF